MHQIPLFDLSREIKKNRHHYLSKFGEILDNTNFVHGKEIEEFERLYADFCNTKYAIGVHSGTDALILAIKALNISEGDEVLTTPCTFIATADSIIHAGGTPVFVDVLKENGNIDPKHIEKSITSKTRAILVVHLYGIPCDMDEILKIAKKYSLAIIEDASHAHGSVYKNQPVGSLGDIGCFSLYPSKTIGAVGNSGVIVTNSKKLHKRIRILAQHGIHSYSTKYTHHEPGFNLLMDSLQATILIEKLKVAKSVIRKKRNIAALYSRALDYTQHTAMTWSSNVEPSLYVYAFQAKNRRAVMKHFSDNTISTGIYYPTPLHLQPSMKKLGYKQGDFPAAEHFFNHTISVPLFAELTKTEITRIITALVTLPKK